MINLSKYDYSKVKEEDKLIFFQAETMNQIEWQSKRPLWRKFIFPFYPDTIPQKYIRREKW